ncbi:MAG TPA: hypothetical protein VGX76_06005 [Pirellulales bacterium]|nr:hypothetical protein [Pirellulales bacterium]
MPGKTIPKNQLPFSANGKVLDQGLKLEALGIFSARIAAGEPEIAPNQSGSILEIDAHALIIPAASEGNGRAWQDHQDGAGLDSQVPLLR